MLQIRSHRCTVAAVFSKSSTGACPDWCFDEQHEHRVLQLASVVLQNLPAPLSEEYYNLCEMPLESIRNAGMFWVQHCHKELQHYIEDVTTVTDLLTTLRYGVSPDGAIEFIRTGYIAPTFQARPVYPAYLAKELDYGLRMLDKHWHCFEHNANESQSETMERFEEAVEFLLMRVNNVSDTGFPAACVVDINSLD